MVLFNSNNMRLTTSISIILVSWLSLFTSVTLASPFSKLRLPYLSKRDVIITNKTETRVEIIYTNITYTNTTSDCPADKVVFPDSSSVLLKYPTLYKGDACPANTDLSSFLQPQINGGVSTVVLQSFAPQLAFVKVNESEVNIEITNTTAHQHCSVLMEFVVPIGWQMGVVSSDLVYPGTLKLDPGLTFTQTTIYQWNTELGPPTDPGAIGPMASCGISGATDQSFHCSLPPLSTELIRWSPCSSETRPFVTLGMDTQYVMGETSANPGDTGLLTVSGATAPVSLLQLVGFQWQKCTPKNETVVTDGVFWGK